MAPPGAGRSAASDADGEIRVLHVDDEPSFLELSADMLAETDADLVIHTAEDAEAGLAILESEGIDCVVSDYDMPGMDGLDLLERVRTEHGDLPFILFTGKGSEEIASEATSAGVTDYLQKGWGLDQFTVLANRIERYVDRNRTAGALAESRRRLSTLMANLPGMAYRCQNEPEWPAEFVSEGVVDLVGYTPDELESGAVQWGPDVMHPGDRDRVWGAVQEAIDAREPFEITYRIHTAEGELRWVWEQGQGVRDDEGELVAIEGFVTDITERRELESELEVTARRLEAVIEASPVPVVALDAEGRVTVWNDAAEETFGWTAEEVIGGPLPIVPPDRREEHESIRDRIRSGESIEGLELERRTAEGEPIRVRLSSAPLRGPGGEFDGEMSILIEVEDRDD